MGKFNDMSELMSELMLDSDYEMLEDFTVSPKKINSEFKFTYISNSEFNAIHKQVKRERQKKREEKKWEKFMEKQQAQENKVEGRDASTITNVAVINHNDPKLNNEPETTTQGDSISVNEELIRPHYDPNVKEIYTAEVALKNPSQNIIQFVHVSSDIHGNNKTGHAQNSYKFREQLGTKYIVGKIERFQARIITTLQVIGDILSKHPYDSYLKHGIDMKKNQVRNVAFSKRFKSNYHYHLVCQMKSIEKLLKNKALPKAQPNLKVIEKLLSSHQVIFQALQVVEKHLIGTYPVNETFCWLEDFTDLISNLYNLPSCYEKALENYNEMKNACQELIYIINNFNHRMAELELFEKFNRPLKKQYYTSSGEDFRFTCISDNEFNEIYKQVKRERQRKQEAKDWEKFLTKRQQAQLKNDKCCQSFVLIQDEKLEISTQTEYNQMKDKNILANFEKKSHNINKKPEGHHGKMNVPIGGMEQPMSMLDVKDKEILILRRTKSSPIQKERDEKALANVELKNLIKKFDDLRRKIVLTVNGIEQALNDEPLDISREEVDILRSKKRNSAFTSRFKGNYHYQLVCQINDIKKILSNEIILKTRPYIIMQKFVSAHQNVLQALQALEKHLLASCSSEESFRWLKEFIESICELTSMLPNYDGINIDTVDNHSNVNLACQQLMDKIDRLNERREAEAKILKKRASRKIKSGNAPQDNLWMYRTHRLTWKEKAADLAKFQIARRKRRKGVKDELLCEKTVEPSELKLLKMEVKQREGSELRRHSRSVREEQVRTMMEIIPEESESDVEIKKNVKGDLTQEESIKQDNEPAKAKLQELIDCRNAVMLAAKTEEQKKEEIEQKSEFPSNVKLVYIKCENEDIKPSRLFKLSRPSSPISESNKLFHVENKDVICDYRSAFKNFKTKSVWYDENVNNMINSITTRLTDEIIKDVVKEINVDHIIRKIIDLELQEL